MARLDGSRLKALRARRGLSQVQLAKQAHVARNTINRLEMGDREPSPELRARLAEALSVPISELVGGPMDRYGYQYEKLGDAVRNLMSLTMKPETRIVGAMLEFEHAFRAAVPPPDGRQAYEKIQRLMACEGSYEERALHLGEMDLIELKNAFWELDRSVSRAYYEAIAR